MNGQYHGNEASDELEVLEVVRVDVGGRVDLQAVVVLPSVLKQTVHGVQHLVGQQEEPLPAHIHTHTHTRGHAHTDYLDWFSGWKVERVQGTGQVPWRAH